MPSDLAFCKDDLTRVLNLAPSEAPRRRKRGRRRRVGREFAWLVCGIPLFIALGLRGEAAEAAVTKDQIKIYAYYQFKELKQYRCYHNLISKESSWNYKARNGSHYGLAQMRNKLMKYKSPFQQIDYSLKYIKHRYGITAIGDADACMAWSYFQIKGWH
jgi:hypothetical protein